MFVSLFSIAILSSLLEFQQAYGSSRAHLQENVEQ